ncbi:hypothetical protein Q3G72_032284 [Acer saccharum]|nr:hypothetical protein Q3G72_032284 [Acer saccharum]
MPKPRIDCSFKDGKKGVRSFAEAVSSSWQPMLMKNQRMISEENRDGSRRQEVFSSRRAGGENKCERDQGVHTVDNAPSCFNPSQEEVENQDSFKKGNSREKKTYIEIDESSMELCSEENAREGCGKSVKGIGLGNHELNGTSFNSKKGVGDNPPLFVVSVRRSSGCGKLELIPRKGLGCSVVNPREGCSGRVWDQSDNVNLLQLRSEDDRVGGGSSLGDDGLVSDVEATARKESSKRFMKLDKGYEVSELSISDKARDGCHFFSKKKSMVDSKGIAKLSCENRGVLANGDLVDGKGLLLNSNFLRCDSVLLSGKGGSDNEKFRSNHSSNHRSNHSSGEVGKQC